MQLTFTALLPLLAAIAEARHVPLRRHRQDRQRLHFQQARHLDVALDERGLPITATTTVVVDMTSTQTIWVPHTPTGQVTFVPTQSASESVTSVWESGSSSSSGSASVSDWEASSAAPTESTSYSSESNDMPASTSSSDWASSAVSSTSAWVSETSSSDQASATASSTSSDSASDSSSAASAAVTDSSISSVSAPDATATSSASSMSAADAGPSSSYSDSLTEASAPPSSIASSSASASDETSSVRWTRTSASGAPQSTSASADASASPSEMASDSTSIRWTRTSESGVPQSTAISVNATSSAPSVSTSASIEPSTSSMWNETAVSSSAAISSSILPSSTSASSSAAPVNTRLPNVPTTIMAGYYPDWSAWTLPPESVDWTKFDIVDFAFALPTADGRLEFTQDDSSSLLQRLVAGAHKNGKRVKLSIGGWTGSRYFSTLVANPTKRANFVNNCVQAYLSYGLDGIDIDWEYPNAQGAGGNAISSADSANFLLYLTELRAALPSEAIITLATQVWPFAGANGQPLSDVSGFAAVIDWILVMNYDIWGSSDNPGPNAPLSDACGNSTQPLANAYASIASWSAAGMPPHKITLGVPAYGYLQKSRASHLRQRDYIPPSADEVARLDSSLDKRQSGIVTVRNGGGGDDNGQIGFSDLVGQGALALDGSGKFIGAGGFYREWDACSSTPWIRSSYTGQVVTYDDPDSLSMKAQFARQSGLRGCNMFSMDGDWTGSSWPLADALRSGMGI